MIDVILAVIAWKRGWGPKAFIPVVIVFALGFLIGLAGLNLGAGIWLLNLASWSVLGFMIAKPPQRPEPVPTVPTVPTVYSESRA